MGGEPVTTRTPFLSIWGNKRILSPCTKRELGR